MWNVYSPAFTRASSGKPLNVPLIAVVLVLSTSINEIPSGRLPASISVNCKAGFSSVSPLATSLSIVAALPLNSTSSVASAFSLTIFPTVSCPIVSSPGASDALVPDPAPTVIVLLIVPLPPNVPPCTVTALLYGPLITSAPLLTVVAP